ncbi:MAG: TIGR00730 family Rossman fold protein [Bdellovibrionota bacterium]
MTDKRAASCEWGKDSRSKEELRFLEGPGGRIKDFWRVLRIGGELIRGFRKFHFLPPCVTIFGSARFPDSHPYYQLARTTAQEIGRIGFTIMTGGGPGIMEAANRGAKDVGAHSVGCNIKLPHEQQPNGYLDDWMEFNYFFVRKVMLIKYSYAFIALPGGFGTLDEIYETATLVQTEKIKDFPLILIGTEFWKPLFDFMEQRLLASQTILQGDFDRFLLTDSPQEAAEWVKEAATRQFGLTLPEPPKPFSLLKRE